jgi:hypothetical protein
LASRKVGWNALLSAPIAGNTIGIEPKCNCIRRESCHESDMLAAYNRAALIDLLGARPRSVGSPSYGRGRSPSLLRTGQ